MLGIILGVSIPCIWVHPDSRDVRTIYYQGVNASQAQVAKYTGSRGFTATTGEHVVCAQAIDVIENPFIGKELDEIQLKDVCTGKYEAVKFFLRHPIRVIEQCFNNFGENKMYGITVYPTAQKRRSESLQGHTVSMKKMSLGQGIDIAEHKARYNLCVQQYPDCDIILFGVSRGAATTFNASVRNCYDMSKVKLIVLEACFDSVASAAHNSPFFLHSKRIEKIFLKILSLCTNFDEDGIAPIKLAKGFPENVPVLFVTSKNDNVVPYASVQSLVHTLKMRGKNPIYMLVLENSSHPGYMMCSKKDAENYRDCMHALYKQLSLPYIPAYAQLGEEKDLLAKCLV